MERKIFIMRARRLKRQVAAKAAHLQRWYEKSLLQVLPSVQRQQQQRQQQQQTMTTSSPINELEGPEVKFDPWIMTLAQSL
jgi:hypothetical protein